jgi:hypothetical protein
LDRRGFAVAN